MRKGSLLQIAAGMALAGMAQHVPYIIEGIVPDPVQPDLIARQLSTGRSHYKGHRGQFINALEKRRAANKRARVARRAERMGRHTATGRRALLNVSLYGY